MPLETVATCHVRIVLPCFLILGGNGAAKVGGTYDRGCAAVIFTIDNLLQPCCKPMADLLESLKAPQGSMTNRALNMLKDKVKVTLLTRVPRRFQHNCVRTARTRARMCFPAV